MIRSSRDSGPKVASALRAATGASGVLPTPGGKSRATTSGSSRIAVSAGTEAATQPLAEADLEPESCATWMPIGLADVAVIHSADETARLAIAQNIR